MAELQDPELLRTVLDGLQTGVCVIGREHRVLFWNQGAERITGFHPHDVIGHLVRETMLPPCNGRACLACGATCPFAGVLSEGKFLQAKIELRHKEGHRVPVRTWVVPLRDHHGVFIGAVLSFDQHIHVAERSQREHSLAAYGCLDEVTQIPNHSFTQFHLRENLASFGEYHLPFGVLLVQVNALENFRASFGPEAGDAVLRVVAQTIKNTLRPSDFLGRWTQEQFVVILLNSAAPGVRDAADRIRRLVACANLKWWGDDLQVTTSLGQATAQPGDTIDSLLSRAQQSLGGAPCRSAAAAGGAGAQPD